MFHYLPRFCTSHAGGWPWDFFRHQVSGWIPASQNHATDGDDPSSKEIEGFAATHCNCKNKAKISKDVKPNQFINKFRNHIYINNVKDKRKFMGKSQPPPSWFFWCLVVGCAIKPSSLRPECQDGFSAEDISHPAHPWFLGMCWRGSGLWVKNCSGRIIEYQVSVQGYLGGIYPPPSNSQN